MSDRERMLGAIRTALADVPAGEPAAWDPARDDDPAAAYSRDPGAVAAVAAGEPDPGAVAAVAAPEPGAGARAELFAQRCGDYRATVTRCGRGAGEIAGAVGEACARHGVTELLAAPELDPEWLPPGVGARRDEPPLSLAELDAAAGTLTGCAVAIAETGTIVLDGGPGQGRRALSLVPDLHICVVDAGQLVAGVPDAVRRMERSARAGRPLTLISGPSATSDIELVRVEGVHGPRRLEVVLCA